MRLSRIGAALGASISLLCVSAFDSAADSGSRLVIACFNPSHLGALSSSPQSTAVKEAFDAGSCLALSSGNDVRSLERSDGAWRFHIGASAKWLYAPEWGASVGSAASSYDGARADAYADYVPVTTALLERGHGLASCREEAVSLDSQSDSFDKEWAEYWDTMPDSRSPSGMRHVVYMADKGQRLIAQREALGARWNELTARCEKFEGMSIDKGFAEFLFGDSLES